MTDPKPLPPNAQMAIRKTTETLVSIRRQFKRLRALIVQREGEAALKLLGDLQDDLTSAIEIQQALLEKNFDKAMRLFDQLVGEDLKK